ncbi:MAG TPA: ATP-binding protein [Candidatus Thermoplasmatota archaeon]|nr:ATP-binding protein [Candidatus Thermoplasmatota archaeon]
MEQYVEREKAAALARHRENLKAELASRIHSGRAIEGVHIVDLSHHEGGADWAVVRCVENFSKFRTGSSLVIHRGDPAQGTACRLLTEGEREFRIGPEFRQALRGLKVGNGWIIDEGWSDYSENLSRALGDLRASPRRHWIHDLLSGEHKPTSDPIRLARGHELSRGLKLDEDQAEAFAGAFAANGYHLIQGPPGSGKTAVLAQLAGTLAAQGQKVLVTAVTHRAINHALRKTQALRFGADVVKVGGSERADDDVTTFNSFQEWREQAARGGVVVGATCHTRLDYTFFDTVIFDEASQFPIPLAIRGMLYGKRYVFIGDDQQMDPVVVADHPDPWVAWSIFRLLQRHDPGTMLRTTYRLNDALNEFPSNAFYGGQLKPSKDAASRRIHFTKRPRHWDILDPSVPSVVVDVPHQGATVRSPEEARLAAALALDAINAGVPAHEVGIITPFRAQERLIKHELSRQAGRSGVPRGLVVETVERIQGQEREMTILSLTVSDLAYAADAAEFFFRPSRFNVALTRARSKRVVLMDPGLLRLRPSKAFEAWVANLRAFHAGATKANPPNEGAS